mgnify:CR=1 FL=1
MKHFRFLLFIALLLGSIGCSKNEEPDYVQRTSYFKNTVEGQGDDSVIKCVTFNMHLGFRDTQDPWDRLQTGATKAHLDSLAAFIISADADIICLQEVPRNRSNAEIKSFLEELASLVNMNYAFGAHGYNDPYGVVPVHGEWGNAILTKFEIASIDNYENEYNDVWERRSVLNAELILGAERYNVYSLHFIPSSVAAQNLAVYLERDKHNRQIIMGDFNMLQVDELVNNGYTDVFKSDSSKVIFDIDLIFVSAGHFKVLDYYEVPGSQGLSDHEANACILTKL